MDYTDNASLAIVIATLVQWLKKSTFLSVIGEKTSLVNKFVSGLLAFTTSLGVTIAHQGNFLDGMQISIAVPSIVVLGKAFIVQWGMQEAYYQKILKQKKSELVEDASK